MKHLTLAELHHTPLNVRSTFGKDSKIDALVASIEAHGLLQPLVAVKNGDGYKVVAGGRRLAALQRLNWDKKIPVTVIDEAHAREASLAENMIRQPLTPMETYEAIVSLGKDGVGLTQKDIAARFGQPIKMIREAMRLGTIHPDIRAAFQAGEISYESLTAYGATPDQERQLAVFQEQDGNFERPWLIRQALGFGDYDLKRMLKYVGETDYKAAGGGIETDLFSEDKAVTDPALLIRLDAEKRTASDARKAALYCIEHLTDTDGWEREYWVRFINNEADTERAEEIRDTLRDASEDMPDENREALSEELESIESREFPELDEAKTYGFYQDQFYTKQEEAEPTSEPEEDETPPEDPGIFVSQKAKTWLDEARRDRRTLTLARDANGHQYEAERAIFSLLRAVGSRAARLDGAGWITLPGNLVDADWLIEHDDTAAYKLFMQADMSDRAKVYASSIGALMMAGYDNELVDKWATESTQLEWDSDPEFWALFAKKTQLLELARDIDPIIVSWLENRKVADMRTMLHELCSGEDNTKTQQLEESVRNAARAWVPEWLRFEGEAA